MIFHDVIQNIQRKTAKLEAHHTVDGRNPASYKVGPYNRYKLQMELFHPYKWPKINGFHWTYFNLK